MTSTAKSLVRAKYAEATQTTQYTAVNCKTVIDKFTVSNGTGGNVTISINFVPPAGTVGAGNLIISNKSIAPGQCYTCPELVGKLIESTGFISTIAGAATSLVIEVNGHEIT